MAPLRTLAALCLALFAVAGSVSAQPAEGPVRAGDLEIAAPWMREPPPGANVAAGYLSIRNTGEEADTLKGVAVSFARRSEIHEMAMSGGTMMMRPLPDGLVIAPGDTVTLQPGGLHLMFMGLTERPGEGETVRVTLTFDRAGEVTLDAPVASLGASGPPGE